MRIGHARASTFRPSLETQTDSLHAAGVTRIFAEKISTRAVTRPSSAETRARQELPPGTRVLWTRTVPGKRGVPGEDCSQEQFESATLAAVLGDGQVNVEFLNSSTGGAAPVTEELFSTWNARAVAQAPAC